MIIDVSQVLTMSSLEMVSYINSTRKASEAELTHSNFTAEVQKVIGEATPKFLEVDIFTNGSGGKVERKVYSFLKREAMLMAMSYSMNCKLRFSMLGNEP